MKLTVRVNPQDPTRMAVDTEDGTWTSWITISDGCWQNKDELADWQEFTLAVPTPDRAFKPGDVADVKHSDGAKRAVRLGDVWYGTADDHYFGHDDRIRTAGYVYIGNVSSL